MVLRWRRIQKACLSPQTLLLTRWETILSLMAIQGGEQNHHISMNPLTGLILSQTAFY